MSQCTETFWKCRPVCSLVPAVSQRIKQQSCKYSNLISNYETINDNTVRDNLIQECDNQLEAQVCLIQVCKWKLNTDMDPIRFQQYRIPVRVAADSIIVEKGTFLDTLNHTLGTFT